jgi:hypothetical protein
VEHNGLVVRFVLLAKHPLPVEELDLGKMLRKFFRQDALQTTISIVRTVLFLDFGAFHANPDFLNSRETTSDTCGKQAFLGIPSYCPDALFVGSAPSVIVLHSKADEGRAILVHKRFSELEK